MTNKIQAAVITPVLAAGSTSTPYYYLINLTQRLCCPTCVEETPVFAPQFSLVGLSTIGTTNMWRPSACRASSLTYLEMVVALAPRRSLSAKSFPFLFRAKPLLHR